MLTVNDIGICRELLADADREYEAGDMLQASEKLWGAASHVVIAEMKRRGMPTKSHRALVQTVEQFSEEIGDHSLRDMSAIARMFHHNFHNGTMDNYEFIADRPTVHRFMDRMMALSQASEN